MTDEVKPDPASPQDPVKAKFWPPEAPHRLRWVLMVVAGLLLIGGGFTYYRIHRNVSQASAFCLSCHQGVKSELESQFHEHIECGQCHRIDPRIQVKFWFQPGSAKATPHGQVDLNRCRDCHFERRKDSSAAKSIGHQNHVTVKSNLTCDKCHKLSRHSMRVDPAACGQCHDKVKVHEHGMDQVACLSCHQFTKAGNAGDPGATGCPTCHSGKPKQPGQTLIATKTRPINATVVHGNVNACRLCHEPHRPDPVNRRHAGECAACHRRVVEQHIEANIPAHRDCSKCHSVHGPRPKTPELCAECHERQLPKKGRVDLAAKHQGCSGCHEAHGFRPKVARCIECHAPIQETLTSWPSAAHANCLDCHSGHSTRETASACVRCHQAQQSHGHEKCTTCHSPHQDRSFAKKCDVCHAPVFSSVANAPVAQHRTCNTCHATHAPAQAPFRCAGCHRQQATLVAQASPKVHQACQSCHLPHQFAKGDHACINCHRTAGLGNHDAGCIKCHKPHGSPGRPQLDCRSCHSSVGTGRGHHEDCLSCHSVHASKRGGPSCGDCHAPVATAVKSWKPMPHQDCRSCHERHSAKPPKNCADCHSEKTGQPLAKGHQCAGCHNPHRAPTVGNATCATCHRNVLGLVSGATPTHSECKNCHNPHSNTLPMCVSCHQNRAGAHNVKGHQLCSSCHKTHQVRFTGRDKCLACHTDKTNHFPNAATCVACHNFR